MDPCTTEKGGPGRPTSRSRLPSTQIQAMYQQNHSPESTEENDKASLTASPPPPRKRLFLYATSSILFVVICAALVFSPPRPGGYPPLCGVPVLNSHKSTVCVEVPQITQGERRMTDGREVLTERASFACNGDTTAFDPVECASKCNGDMLWVEVSRSERRSESCIM